MERVVVIGGGIAGLSVAAAAVRRGLRVAVVEPQTAVSTSGPGGPASAGMLLPFTEAKAGSPVLGLSYEALRYYPEFLRWIGEFSPIDTGFRRPGGIRVADDEETATELAAVADMVTRTLPAVDVCRLSAPELREYVPGIAGTPELAIFFPEEALVVPRQLLRALRHALAGQVEWHVGQPAVRLRWENTRCVGVETPEGSVFGDRTVLCAGAWIGSLLAAAGIEPPVFPLLGQLGVLEGPTPLTRTVFFTPGGYVAPWSDGTLCAGATELDVGYSVDHRTELFFGVMDRLRQWIPGLGQYTLVEMRAGLRPTTVDGLPLLGPVPGMPGLDVAGGYYRNGILLGPYLGELLARSWYGEAPIPEICLPDRIWN